MKDRTNHWACSTTIMQSVALMTLALLSKPLLSPVVKGTSNRWGPTHNWTKLWAMRGHYTCPVLIWVPEFYIGNYLRAARGRGRVRRRCPTATRASRLQDVNLSNWADCTAAAVLSEVVESYSWFDTCQRFEMVVPAGRQPKVSVFQTYPQFHRRSLQSACPSDCSRS